jgi:hypothetical protein
MRRAGVGWLMTAQLLSLWHYVPLSFTCVVCLWAFGDQARLKRHEQLKMREAAEQERAAEEIRKQVSFAHAGMHLQIHASVSRRQFGRSPSANGSEAAHAYCVLA